MTQKFVFPNKRYLLVGTIAKAHGLRGEVKLQSYSDDPGTLLNYTRLVLVTGDGKITAPLQVIRARLQGKQVIVQLEGITDRTIAEQLQGTGVLVEKMELCPLDQDEYYWYQLEHKRVITEEGRLVGQVRSVFSNGAQDVIVVESDEDEYLIPLAGDIIKEIREREIIINPPPGLLEINAEKM